MLLITSLPATMRKQGWSVAAACMERWFRFGPHELTADEKTGRTPMDALPAPTLATDILKMDWAVGFARVRSAVDELIARRWNTPGGRTELLVKLRAWQTANPLQSKPGLTWTFGDLNRTVPFIDTHFEVNYLTVGGLSDPLDDFYGAVGRGTLKAAVTGDITNGKDGRPVAMQVKALGIYLRDTDDFVGEQFLGLWSEDGVDRSRGDEFLAYHFSIATPIAIDAEEYARNAARQREDNSRVTVSPDGMMVPPIQLSPAQQQDAERRQWHSVSNADFRRYMRKAMKGHDYVNVSDLRQVRLPQPVTITFLT